jgi:hypothetical protein
MQLRSMVVNMSGRMVLAGSYCGGFWRERLAKPEHVKPLLKLLSREESEGLVSVRERLQALDIVGVM